MALSKRARRARIFEARELKTAEQRLVVAMLKRAISDYLGSDEQVASDADTWIFDEMTQGPYEAFTFGWVCEQLDTDVKQMAGAIAALRETSRKIDARNL